MLACMLLYVCTNISTYIYIYIDAYCAIEACRGVCCVPGRSSFAGVKLCVLGIMCPAPLLCACTCNAKQRDEI